MSQASMPEVRANQILGYIDGARSSRRDGSLSRIDRQNIVEQYHDYRGGLDTHNGKNYFDQLVFMALNSAGERDAIRTLGLSFNPRYLPSNGDFGERQVTALKAFPARVIAFAKGANADGVQRTDYEAVAAYFMKNLATATMAGVEPRQFIAAFDQNQGGTVKFPTNLRRGIEAALRRDGFSIEIDGDRWT